MLQLHQLKLLSNVFFLNFLAACTLHQQPPLKQQDSFAELCAEARLIDVPLPVTACIHKTRCSADSAQLIPFTAAQSAESIIEFYHHEMERLGWREDALWQFPDIYHIVYTKPQRIMILCVRRVSNCASECELLVGEKQLY